MHTSIFNAYLNIQKYLFIVSNHLVITSSYMNSTLSLDGPRIESRLGRDFPYPSRPALGPAHPPIQWIPGLSWGKAAAGWR
jgi:hypothetical protein